MSNILVGKKIVAVHLAEDKGAIRFDVEGGGTIIARADGDCCSRTWIEEVQGPEQLIGAMVVSVEDVDMPEPEYDKSKFDSLAFYGCKIVSDRGYCLIDFRNESNGYYGGSLEWPRADGKDYYYGGVWGQNRSKEKWKQIAGEEPRHAD